MRAERPCANRDQSVGGLTCPDCGWDSWYHRDDLDEYLAVNGLEIQGENIVEKVT